MNIRAIITSSRFSSFSPNRLVEPISGRIPQIVTADEAIDATIKSDCDVFVHSHSSTPTELLDALCRTVDRRNLTDVRPIHTTLQGNLQFIDQKYWGRIRSNCLFIGAAHRKLVAAGAADYIPVFLSDIPRLFEQKVIPCDVALMSVSTPDSNGFCSVGTDIECSTAAVAEAKKVVALVNPHIPRTFGESTIHSSHIDYMVNVDRPIYSKKDSTLPNALESKIGKIIADNLVEDGATLQLGIGAIPDSTLFAMKNHKDLGMHTEMLSDGVLDLLEKGVVTNNKKTVLPGKVVTSFAYGTQRLYDTVNNNPNFHFASCGWTNNVDVIRSNSKMTCINAALEVDLTGQIVSDSIGPKFYSGFGGQVDFMFGAGTAKDNKGKAIIAMTSRTTKGIPKIVPILKKGAGVVTTRGHVHYVVTEYGIAYLWGKNVRQRAHALIGIAHPDDREELEKASFERLRCMPSA